MGKAFWILLGGFIFTALILVLFSGPTGNIPRTTMKVEDGYVVKLRPMEDTGTFNGRVKLAPSDTVVVVKVTLKGVEAHRKYDVHWHEGECARGAGGGVSLKPVLATEGETGVSRSVVPFSEFNPTMSHLVMVHRPDGRHALCGDVPSIKRLKEFDNGQQRG